VDKIDYDSFGNRKPGVHLISQPYSYTGREWDKETGLYYYRARYYDPGVGRFISKDPIGFKGGINLYNYVGGNPVNFIDSSGEVCYAYNRIPPQFISLIPKSALDIIRNSCIGCCCLGVEITFTGNDASTIGPAVKTNYYAGICTVCQK
jgi:RHS repeat-associated protein